MRTRLFWACLVLLTTAGCSWFSDSASTSTTVEATTTTAEPVVGFSFDDALVLGVDLETVPAVVTIPDCFGGVGRVAVVSEDLRETAWEIVARDAENPPELSTVDVGVAPEGFDTVVPLAEGSALAGVVVANGPDHLGLVAIDRNTDPHGCN